MSVQLVGVFDPDGKDEGFVYTVNAPQNLWIGAICSDGSRMGHEFMAFFLNQLIEEDKWNTGDSTDVTNQVGVLLRATVLEPVISSDVEANMALTEYVYPISVEVVH